MGQPNKIAAGVAVAALIAAGALYVMLLRSDLAATRDRADAAHRTALDLIDAASDQCLDQLLPDRLIEEVKR